MGQAQPNASSSSDQEPHGHARDVPSDLRASSHLKFFVLCSDCRTLQEGKLRVRCGACRSDAFSLNNAMPPTLAEALKYRHQGHCFACVTADNIEGGDVIGEFYAKCAECDAEDVIQLELIRGARGPDGAPSDTQVCPSCLEDRDTFIEFPCGECFVCVATGEQRQAMLYGGAPATTGDSGGDLGTSADPPQGSLAGGRLDTGDADYDDCFTRYCKARLGEAATSVVRDSRSGHFTFGCPNAQHRNSLIHNIKHFKMCGRAVYDRYKKMAASKTCAAFCPTCDCGLVDIESRTTSVRICCPACGGGLCSKDGCHEKWPDGAEHVCEVPDEYFHTKECPNPLCTQRHVHYFQHECHHMGVGGGCPGTNQVECGIHFCWMCLTAVPQCLTEGCTHTNRDCTCPLFCHVDPATGKECCPRCHGCSEHGGRCDIHGECKLYCECP